MAPVARPFVRAGAEASAPVGQDAGIGWATILLATAKSRGFVQLTLVALMSNLFMFCLPLFSMSVFDKAIPHQAYETLWALATGILLVLVIDLTSRILRGRIERGIAAKLSFGFQQRIFRSALLAETEAAPKSGSLVISAVQAVDAACMLAPAMLVAVLIDLPFVVGLTLYIAFSAGWVVMAPVLCAAIVLTATMLAYSAGRRSHAGSATTMVERNALIEENVSALATLRLTASGRQAARQIEAKARASLVHALQARAGGFVSGQISLVAMQFNAAAALVIGTYAVNAADLTVGGLSATVMLVGRGIAPLLNLATAGLRAGELAEGLTMANRISCLQPEAGGDTGGAGERIKGAVHFAAVVLTYPDAPDHALNNVTLSIAAGERVAIIGGMGSGKSSLLNLVPRLNLATSGGVLIDAQDVRQHDPDHLRRQISYMPQDCELWDASIRENITRGLVEVDEAAFLRAARLAGVDGIVARHPLGYALRVGRGGKHLSGGERQAICLARAMVRGGAIILLDEPTSAMDSLMERGVIERLRGEIEGRTLVLATHRLPMLDLVDRVIWMDRGTVVADGPKADILARLGRGG